MEEGKDQTEKNHYYMKKVKHQFHLILQLILYQNQKCYVINYTGTW